MERFESPCAVFQAAADSLRDENFSAVAECVDPFSLRVFRDELLESHRTLPLRDQLALASSPAEAFAEWLRWVSPRAKIARMVESGRLAADVARHLCSPHPPLPDLMIVGVIEEDGQFAHLLYRTPTAALDPASLNPFPEEERIARRALATYASVSVAQARRQFDGSWRLIAQRTFLNFDREHAFAVVKGDAKTSKG